MDSAGIRFDSHRVWRGCCGDGTASPTDEIVSTDENTSPYSYCDFDADGRSRGRWGTKR